MTWQSTLNLDYSLEAGRCVARHVHNGPLRVLQSLYPEGDGICHNVLIHPPGGLVGGDRIDLHVNVAEGAHGLITTPGATRFYRSLAGLALQHTRLSLAAGARLEWLPLETLLYAGCDAENRLQMDLAPGAELIGWDVTALGLPLADLAFDRGRCVQHLEWPGVWLERGVLDASDSRLMDSPLGLAGRKCLSCLYFGGGTALVRPRRDALLDAARACISGHARQAWAGVTSPSPQLLVLRVLSDQVEPAMQLLKSVWATWRHTAWGLSAATPRIWAM
jgi:urease accessory protein